jgi:outer membrane immunogenic protein
MTTRILAALAFASLLTGTAAAADLYVPTPDQAIVSASRDWTGFYIGANVGYADFDAAHGGDESDLATLNGWQGGVQAGYNVQFDSIVLGIEADLSAAGILEGSDTDHWNEDAGINGLATLRGRLGFAVGDLLLYGTAGLAAANLEVYDEAQTIGGWVAGVGAEYMVTDTVSLKAEYLYTNFGTVEVDGYGGDEFDIDGSAVRVGVNFHF